MKFHVKYVRESVLMAISVGTMGSVGAAAPTIIWQWVQTMYSAPTIFTNKNKNEGRQVKTHEVSLIRPVRGSTGWCMTNLSRISGGVTQPEPSCETFQPTNRF